MGNIPHLLKEGAARRAIVKGNEKAKAKLEIPRRLPVRHQRLGYTDNKKVRVAGPFTVESLSPHRILGVDENDELIDGLRDDGDEYNAKKSFPEMILENLKIAGVQQAHKEDRIAFTALSSGQAN